MVLFSVPCFSQAVNGLTMNVRKMFMDMDQELFEECQRQFQEDESNAAEIEAQRVRTWNRLEEAAERKSKQGTA